MKRSRTWIVLGLVLFVTLFVTDGGFAQQSQAPTPPSTPGQLSPPAVPRPDIKKPEMPKPEIKKPETKSFSSPTEQVNQIKALEARVKALEERVKTLEAKAK